MANAAPNEKPNAEQGACEKCGHLNSRAWVMCDECGARLPWAMPKPTLKIGEMTTEQLAARFGNPQPRQAPFLLRREGRKSLWLCIFVGSALLSLLQLLLHR